MATNQDMISLVLQYSTDNLKKALVGDMKTVAENVTEYKIYKDEFLDILIGKIAQQKFNSKLYQNPYSSLIKEPLPFGSTIESIFVEMAEMKDFSENFGAGNTEVGSLIGEEKPKVITEYYIKNFAKKVKISISDQMLKSAFINPNGLSTMVNQCLMAPLNAIQNYQAQLVKGCLNNQKRPNLTITGYSALTDKKAKAELLTENVRSTVRRFSLLSDCYNQQKVQTFTNPQNICIFITPETEAMLDVYLLSTAFNMDKASLQKRIFVVDGFQKFNTTSSAYETDDKTLCVIADEDYIQIRPTLQVSETFRNADKLRTNVFNHYQGMACCCGFANAVGLQAD